MAISQSMKVHKCRQSQCNISTDGNCLEGLALDQCPYLSIEDEPWEDFEREIGEEDDDEIAQEKELEYLSVFSGEELDARSSSKVMAEELTHVIILAGEAETGKTTLLTSIMDYFQRNSSLAGCIFRGSKTLIGFEKRSHTSRIASERSTADTIRTPHSEPKFLHLKVFALAGSNPRKALLLSDISGETFKGIKNSANAAKNFYLAKRADHFALVIDANQLSSNTERQIAKQGGLAILKRLTTNGMLGTYTHVQVVFSRWDLLLDKKDEGHTEFVDATENEFVHKFGHSFGSLTFHRVASRPAHVNKVPIGYGIEGLFHQWVQNSRWELIKYDPKSIYVDDESLREFSAYKYE